MRIVYFGFDLFYDCFEALLNHDGIEVMALYTFETDNVFEFNSKVVALAKSRNIPVHFNKITEEEIIKHLNNGLDFTVSAGYIHKIPVPCNTRFRGINVHPALLPIGRGAWPYPVTILKGLTESGVTIHKITNRFDEGDILLQESFSVTPQDTLDTLTKKSQILAKDLLLKVVNSFESYWQNATPQTLGEYWTEPTDSDRTISEDMTHEIAERIIRAFGSFGVIYNGKTYRGIENTLTKVQLLDGEIYLK